MTAIAPRHDSLFDLVHRSESGGESHTPDRELIFSFRQRNVETLQTVGAFAAGDRGTLSNLRGRSCFALDQRRHMIERASIALVLAMTAVGTLVAGLSPEKTAWAKGPVQYLLTPEESVQWKGLKTDEEADAFISFFWARRDPTPGTAENEFREAFDARVKFADLHYTVGRKKGSMTARGRAIVLLGAPYSIRETGDKIGADVIEPDKGYGSAAAAEEALVTNPDFSSSDHTGSEREVRTETWVYEHDRAIPFAPTPVVTVYFVDQASTGDFRLGRPADSTDSNVEGIYRLAVASSISLPDLKPPSGMVTVGEPQYHMGATSGVGSALGTMAEGSLHSPALIDAVERMRGATELPFKGVYLSWDEFVTGSGESFVPVQLYLTRLPTLPARPATFFGTVYDQNGAQVASYERPVKLEVSGTAFVADTSLNLPPGKYNGLFGVAIDDNPLAMARGELEVRAIDKSAPGVSGLLLSDDIHPMSAAQLPTDPFSFGGARVVVKGDHLFSQKSDLWFFVELRNPGVDQTGTPRVQMQIDVEGMSGNQPVKLSLPMQDATVAPLKGVEGHYALGQSIPLAKVPSGDYMMNLRVVDNLLHSTYDLTEKFTVAPGI